MNDNVKHRGVYACVADGKIVYIGSSALRLKSLAFNHRNARSKAYTMSKFRMALEAIGDSWTFEWLTTPFACSQKRIEMQEGELIRLHRPIYNVDYSPVQSSIRYGRYT